MHLSVRVYEYLTFISWRVELRSPLKYFCLHIKWTRYLEISQSKTQSHSYHLKQGQIKRTSHVFQVYENAGCLRCDSLHVGVWTPSQVAIFLFRIRITWYDISHLNTKWYTHTIHLFSSHWKPFARKIIQFIFFKLSTNSFSSPAFDSLTKSLK